MKFGKPWPLPPFPSLKESRDAQGGEKPFRGYEYGVKIEAFQRTRIIERAIHVERGSFLEKNPVCMPKISVPAASRPEPTITAFFRFAILLAGLLILQTPLSGCKIAYLFHAAKGQFHLLSGSVPVEEALKTSALSPEEKDRIRLVERVKDFGEKELGLAPTENYTTVYLDKRNHAIYAVSAAPKDRLVMVPWWFPLVGNMPDLGFFDLESARSEKTRLVEQDLDVSIGRADAYSTLGWFKDPITLNLIQSSIRGLSETILHEMTHTTLYLAGQAEFNEGFALLVGKVGSLQFIEQTYGPGDPLSKEARDEVADERLFSAFLDSLAEKLETLYSSDLSYDEKLSKREKIFSEAKEAYKRLKPRLKTRHFDYFESLELNNASLMAVNLYHRNFNLFYAILVENGFSVKELVALFRTLSEKGDDTLAAAREWLSHHSTPPVGGGLLIEGLPAEKVNSGSPLEASPSQAEGSGTTTGSG
jgi:predicted aminopeptidase